MTETLFISVNFGKQLESPESVGIPVACEFASQMIMKNPFKRPNWQYFSELFVFIWFLFQAANGN